MDHGGSELRNEVIVNMKKKSEWGMGGQGGCERRIGFCKNEKKNRVGVW